MVCRRADIVVDRRSNIHSIGNDLERENALDNVPPGRPVLCVDRFDQ